MGTLLLRSIIFNNPTPRFQYSLQYFSFNIFGTIFHFSLSLTRGIGTLLLRFIIFNNSTAFFYIVAFLLCLFGHCPFSLGSMLSRFVRFLSIIELALMWLRIDQWGPKKASNRLLGAHCQLPQPTCSWKWVG